MNPDKLACIHRGPVLQQIEATACGHRGELIDVYQCRAEQNARGQAILRPRKCGQEIPACYLCEWQTLDNGAPNLRAQLEDKGEIKRVSKTPNQGGIAVAIYPDGRPMYPDAAKPIVEEPWIAPAHPIDWFDRVVVISLQRREDRRKDFFDRLHAARWPFHWPEVFAAVDGHAVPKPQGWADGAGAWGCMQSHRQVLERAIMDGVRSLLILEDDALPADDFAERIDSFLASVPADWSQLMLGGQHVQPPESIAPGLVRVQEAHRTHAYAVRGAFLKTLYQTFVSTSGHCDHRMGPLHARARVYAPSPFLLGQAAVHSDIACRPTPQNFW
jgi:hypothetical protein